VYFYKIGSWILCKIIELQTYLLIIMCTMIELLKHSTNWNIYNTIYYMNMGKFIIITIMEGILSMTL
jgi:hypothetical protein